MDIDKLIQYVKRLAAQYRFGSLMDIDKLILADKIADVLTVLVL